MKKLLFILILYSSVAHSQSTLYPRDIVGTDTLWINATGDSLFKKSGGSWVFYFKSTTRNYIDYSIIKNKPSLFSGSYSDLSNKPSLFDGAYNSLTGKPSLFDGAYSSLTGKPTLFDGAYSSLTGKPTLFDGTWGSLSGKPSISGTNTGDQDLSSYAPKASPAFTGTPTGIGLPVYARVTGSDATRTAQTLADITGLSVALTTNAVYEFEAVMGVTSSSSAGNGYGVQYSAAGASVEAQCSGQLLGTSAQNVRITSLNSATIAFVTSGGSGGITIKGIITTGANAGNLTIQHLKVTSGTSTIKINSFLKVTRIS